MSPIINPGGGAGGGGSHSLVDLGALTAVSLKNGPVTLYTPASGTWFEIAVGPAGFVPMDAAAVDVAPNSRISASGVSRPILQWSPFQATYLEVVVGGGVGVLYTIADGTAVKAVLTTDLNTIPILAAPGAWQANHVYAANTVIAVTTHYFSASAGTSAATIPDFSTAPNEGNTVADNTVTWTNEGLQPTAGTVHLYALTATT